MKLTLTFPGSTSMCSLYTDPDKTCFCLTAFKADHSIDWAQSGQNLKSRKHQGWLSGSVHKGAQQLHMRPWKSQGAEPQICFQLVKPCILHVFPCSELDFRLMPTEGLFVELEMRLRCHRMITHGLWICDEFPRYTLLSSTVSAIV